MFMLTKNLDEIKKKSSTLMNTNKSISNNNSVSFLDIFVAANSQNFTTSLYITKIVFSVTKVNILSDMNKLL